MEWIFKALLFVHIAAGFTSLALFWIPVFTPKGRKYHRLVGKMYVWFMWAVTLTAAILSVKNLVIGETFKAAFLGFIAIITANPLWYGIAILKNKQGLSKGFRMGHLAFSIIIVLTGFMLIGYGISLNGEGSAVLMLIFGGLALTDIPQVIKALKKAPMQVDWLKKHIIGMCTSAIAAYTAFLVFGANEFLQSFLPGYLGVLPWVAPGVIGTFAIFYTIGYYRKKGVIK